MNADRKDRLLAPITSTTPRGCNVEISIMVQVDYLGQAPQVRTYQYGPGSTRCHVIFIGRPACSRTRITSRRFDGLKGVKTSFPGPPSAPSSTKSTQKPKMSSSPSTVFSSRFVCALYHDFSAPECLRAARSGHSPAQCAHSEGDHHHRKIHGLNFLVLFMFAAWRIHINSKSGRFILLPILCFEIHI